MGGWMLTSALKKILLNFAANRPGFCIEEIFSMLCAIHSQNSCPRMRGGNGAEKTKILLALIHLFLRKCHSGVP